MDFTDACFDDDDVTLCRTAFDSRVDFDLLLNQGFVSLPTPDAPFANGNFPTPSGRCEFFSPRLAQQGLNGLPDYVPNFEPADTNPQFPLSMISPPARNFLNSSFVNVKSLRDIEGEPHIEISEVDAAHRHIQTGDRVRVFNDRGHYHCKAEVSPRARLGVVNGLGVWWRKLGLHGTNVNELTSQSLTDLGHARTLPLQSKSEPASASWRSQWLGRLVAQIRFARHQCQRVNQSILDRLGPRSHLL